MRNNSLRDLNTSQSRKTNLVEYTTQETVESPKWPPDIGLCGCVQSPALHHIRSFVYDILVFPPFFLGDVRGDTRAHR